MKKAEKIEEKSGVDLCVCCGAEIEYLRSTNVNLRENYVDGAGQLCPTCYNQIYGGK